MMDGLTRTLILIAVISCGFGLSACRDDEQGRPLTKQKGIYEGPADEKLDPERLEDLRSRAAGQKF